VRGGEAPATLIAFTADLKEEWRLRVGTRCNVGNALLTDDGMLYFARLRSFVEFVPVQTTSPSLAKTAWPSSPHDNRATGWLGAASAVTARIQAAPSRRASPEPRPRPARRLAGC
jgi:hypothetical protein